METDRKNFFEETRDLATKYVDDKILLIKLQAAEKAAGISSMLFKVVIAAVLGFFIMSILTFLIGYYLSIWFDSFLFGFGTVILVYVIVLIIVLYAHKKYWHKSISDKVVELMFKEEETK